MPADPATLRAVAARVMAGEATKEEIAIALGWRIQSDLIDGAYWVTYDTGDWFKNLPLFLHSLDAADALFAPLRERGWRLRCGQKDADTWYAIAHRDGPCEIPIAASPAPTEPAARVALALLCLATEGEAGE